MYVNAGLLPHARDLIPRNCKKLLSFGGNKKLLSFGSNKKLLSFGSSFFYPSDHAVLRIESGSASELLQTDQ